MAVAIGELEDDSVAGRWAGFRIEDSLGSGPDGEIWHENVWEWKRKVRGFVPAVEGVSEEPDAEVPTLACVAVTGVGKASEGGFMEFSINGPVGGRGSSGTLSELEAAPNGSVC